MQRNNLRAVRIRVRKDGFLAVLPADAVFGVFDAQAIREVRFDILRQGRQRVKNIRIRAAFQAERFNIVIQRPVILGQAGDFFRAGYQRRVFQPTIGFLCRQIGNRLSDTRPCAGVRIGGQPQEHPLQGQVKVIVRLDGKFQPRQLIDHQRFAAKVSRLNPPVAVQPEEADASRGFFRRIRQAKVNTRVKAAIRRHHIALHRQQAEERFQPLRQLALLCGVLHGVDVRAQSERDALAQRRGQQEHRRQRCRRQPPHQPHSSASAGTICFFRLTTFGSHTW